MRLVTVVASTLTDDAWAPFGWLPVPDTDPRDALQQLHFEWSDPNINVIAHGYDEVEHTDDGVGVRGDVPPRHPHAGAHAAQRPRGRRRRTREPRLLDPEHIDQVRAFVLQPLDVFVLFQGTWHWGPFPLGPESVRLLNVQGVRYAEDNASVDLAARTGAAVEVVVDSER